MRIKILKDYDYKRSKFRVANKDAVIVTRELGTYLISMGVARDISVGYATAAEFDNKLKADPPPPPVTTRLSNRRNRNTETQEATPPVAEETTEDTEQSSPE